MPCANLAALQGRVSPAWESIDVKRHIFLLLCSTHSVTAYEVSKNTYSISELACYKLGSFDNSHSQLKKAIHAAVASLYTFG